MLSNSRSGAICKIIFLLLIATIPPGVTFKCQLFGIDQSSLDTKFIQVKNTSFYQPVLQLGRSEFSGTATSTRIDNKYYISTYHTYDSLGVPHFFLLIIDIHSKMIKLNLTLHESSDSGSFWQVAMVNSSRIIGIRESFHSGSTLEVATIDQRDGHMETVGTYPYGSYSLVMAYASKRRLYYNLIDSTLHAVNVDTGKLSISIPVPNEYVIYGLDYDETNDRLLSLVYCTSVANGWIFTYLTITEKHEMKFERIGKTVIPFEKYLWTTTYAMDSEKRSWITVWSSRDSDDSVFIVLNIDSGSIIEQWETKQRDLSNFVCFH